jgi:hypothetical protein
MISRKNIKLSAILAFGSLASVAATNPSGCGGGYDDYYTGPSAACSYIPHGVVSNGSTLTDACRTALLASFGDKFDSSWSTAPTGLQDRVLEAFQGIIGYPRAFPPQNKILGTAPTDSSGNIIAGAIPLVFYTIYQESDNPNQAVFNYILNQVDLIKYVAPDAENELFGALYGYETPQHPLHWDLRVINVFDGYSSAPDIGIPAYHMTTLIHEARHGDGQYHEVCPSYSRYAGVIECDPQLNYSHGIEVADMVFMLHGGAVPDKNGNVALTPSDVETIGGNLCDSINNFITNKYDALANWCTTNPHPTYAQIMAAEGLSSSASQPATSPAPQTSPSPGPIGGNGGTACGLPVCL